MVFVAWVLVNLGTLHNPLIAPYRRNLIEQLECHSLPSCEFHTWRSLHPRL